MPRPYEGFERRPSRPFDFAQDRRIDKVWEALTGLKTGHYISRISHYM